MIAAPWGSKLRAGFLGSLLLSLIACTPLRRAVPPEALPHRVVLALDGLDYRDVMAARERGRFSAFHPPARLISTFPSISDIAWHAIFGVYPPAGYQRVHYSTRHNAVLGDALSAIRPIEYEERMDHAFDTKFHHLGAYLISWPVARGEVDSDVERILASRDRRTVYLYNVGPDALQHTRGDVAQYLDHLDRRLTELLQRYRDRTGRTLEVIVLSDHGHNRARDAAFVPVVESLAAHGFVTARSLTRPNDVAFSVDGVTTGFGVFCAPDSVARVAALLADIPGVDVVSRQDHDSLFTVLRRTAGDGVLRGEVRWRRVAGEERYAYRPVAGDPLAMGETVARMQREGVLDAEGFASAASWLRHTGTHHYPAAPVRIVHGHVQATRNGAPILVSLDDRYRVGLGMVSVANRMRPLGGTHGALSASNAVGMVMSNGQVPHDDWAVHVREQFGGFDDLLDVRVHQPALAVVEGAMLRGDRLHRRAWPDLSRLPESGPVVMLSTPVSPERWGGDGARVRVEIRRRDTAADGGTLVRRVLLPLRDAARRADGTQWGWPAQQFGLTDLTPGEEYRVHVMLERTALAGDVRVVSRTQTLLAVSLRAATDGVPWSY